MKQILLVCAFVFFCGGLSVQAQWSTDPTVNTPVCTATDYQQSPTIVSNGAGGAIITWSDNRNSGLTSYDIYAQHIDALGVVQWAADGVQVCKAPNQQYSPVIVSDGAGGAIIAWMDYRNSSVDFDIYAQRINAAGVRQWIISGDSNGIPISVSPLNQFYPTLVSDGAGGAIIAWQDYRSAPNNHIYAQRINATGVVQWTTNGVPVSKAPGSQYSPKIASDGGGGAIITWHTSGGGDVYAQRINASGVRQWIVDGDSDGVPLSTAAQDQYGPTIVSDGAGGAIVTWEDNRGGTNNDIYAQRINGSGGVQWALDGIPVSRAPNDQMQQQLTTDGAGGAIITWEDGRSTTNLDIYAQRIDASGARQWIVGDDSNGVPISTASLDQSSPVIVSDRSKGAIITWYDIRSGTSYDIYAQRISAAGQVQWAADGVPISTDANTQWHPSIASNGLDGAIIAWEDFRNGTNSDIYAQSVKTDGTLGPAPFILPVSNRWNMVSVPVTVADYRKSVLFHTAVSPAYAYDGGYTMKDTLTDGAGYWLKFNGGQADSMFGLLHTADTMNVRKGWNMIGSISTLVATTQITSDPGGMITSDFYGYANAKGYYTVDTIKPGLGYWVKVAQDGELILSSSPIITPLTHIRILPGSEQPPAAPQDNVTSMPTQIPKVFALEQNYPNPFNPSTVIHYQLPVESRVTLKIYNVLGQIVKTLADGVQDAGYKAVEFDAGGVASGLYFYRLEATSVSNTSRSFSRVKKMLMVK